MRIRSYIFTATDKGYQGVSVHLNGFFGYPDSVGATLQAHYTDQQTVNQLIKLGDLFVLGNQIMQCEAVKRYGFEAVFTQDFLALSIEEQERLRKDYFSEQYTIPYHRNGGKALQIAEYPTILELLEDLKQGYNMIANIYLFQNGKWYYFDWYNYQWSQLAPKLKQIAKQEETA